MPDFHISQTVSLPKTGAFVDSLPHPAPFCQSILYRQHFICITG